jgi:hypothetical protein
MFAAEGFAAPQLAKCGYVDIHRESAARAASQRSSLLVPAEPQMSLIGPLWRVASARVQRFGETVLIRRSDRSQCALVVPCWHLVMVARFQTADA